MCPLFWQLSLSYLLYFIHLYYVKQLNIFMFFVFQIPHGKKESKDFILRSLLNIVDTPFIPHEVNLIT